MCVRACVQRARNTHTNMQLKCCGTKILMMTKSKKETQSANFISLRKRERARASEKVRCNFELPGLFTHSFAMSSHSITHISLANVAMNMELSAVRYVHHNDGGSVGVGRGGWMCDCVMLLLGQMVCSFGCSF